MNEVYVALVVLFCTNSGCEEVELMQFARTPKIAQSCPDYLANDFRLGGQAVYARCVVRPPKAP